MISTRFLVGAAAAALLLTAGAVSLAQDAPSPPRPDFRAQMQQRIQARREQALADLRQVLKLRPDQDAAFQALQGAMAPPERGPRPPPPAAGETLTTPQMIARRTERVAAMKARMDRRDQAVLAFYATLSPDQQKSFDALVRLRRAQFMLAGGMGRMGPMGRMGGMAGRWGRDGGPPGPPPPPAR